MKLAEVPTLDAIAADPAKAAALPRRAVQDLTVKAIAVQATLLTAFVQNAAEPAAAVEHEDTCDAAEVARLFGVARATIIQTAKRRLPYRDFLIPGTRPMMFSRSKIDRYIRQRAGQPVDDSSVGLRGVNTGRRPRGRATASPGGAA